jgi:hypothetical protein
MCQYNFLKTNQYWYIINDNVGIDCFIREVLTDNMNHFTIQYDTQQNAYNRDSTFTH